MIRFGSYSKYLPLILSLIFQISYSYAWYAKQDLERLLQIRKHVNILPLGSGAIAGNPFAIDRQFLAMELGFDEITENSMHTVGDRDFVGMFYKYISITCVHIYAYIHRASRLTIETINISDSIE